MTSLQRSHERHRDLSGIPEGHVSNAGATLLQTMSAMLDSERRHSDSRARLYTSYLDELPRQQLARIRNRTQRERGGLEVQPSFTVLVYCCTNIASYPGSPPLHATEGPETLASLLTSFSSISSLVPRLSPRAQMTFAPEQNFKKGESLVREIA